MADLIIKKYMMDGLPYYEERAEREIEQNRKGYFSITVTDPAGKPIAGQPVQAVHKVHDFDFGCNFFMYNQYETPAENKRYEEAWKKLFNTAVVPFYWEGTEPEQGYLRYDVNTPNDVYRRPPAQSVVNWGKENGKRLKGHPLFWHEFIAEWLPEDWESLFPLLEKRFSEIAERFGKDVSVFDCVNEPARVWNVHKEHPADGWKHIVPPDDYVKTVFELARKYFPENKLILNEAVGASFSEFHGRYTGYYLNIKDLLSRGVTIDYIGLQCHTGNDPAFRNIYDGARLYEIFDTYADFGKPLVLSEVSVPSVFGGVRDEGFQAEAAQMLYRICFSHKAVNGIFWWNLPDDGVAAVKRKAIGENLPSTGLIDGNWCEKEAYHAIDKLINKDWRTNVTLTTDADGTIHFRGFYGSYDVTVGTQTEAVHLAQGEETKTIRLIG
ncbi:MAG: endo-1,4-beta-xylanase [Eubacteriales bacterium]